MARGQQQGVSSLTVWMILFVALWLTSTVLLVILYTGQEELRTENARLTEDNLRLIKPAERNAVTLFQQARKEGPTVVGLLESARAETARLATGVEGDHPPAVRSKLQEMLGTIRSDRIVPESQTYQEVSYHEALTMLYEAFAAEHKLQREAQDRIAELTADVDRLNRSVSDQQSQLQERVQELRDQLAAAEADHSRYRKERDQEVAELKKNLEQQQKACDADLTDERQHTAALQGKVEEFQQRLGTLLDRFGPFMMAPEEREVARRADGRILRAMPGDPLVYINRGRKDRLVRGMRFAVYSPDEAIPADGQAKAQIEVVSMEDRWSECRVMSVAPRAVITEGDLVANPVYDPDRRISFVVLGGFDLDHDGAVDSDGAAVIESMISDWGGTVSKQVTALTDFVIAGLTPPRPSEKSPASSSLSSSGIPAATGSTLQAYDLYERTIETARTLGIPILPQEVFLNFLGYGVR